MYELNIFHVIREDSIYEAADVLAIPTIPLGLSQNCWWARAENIVTK